MNPRATATALAEVAVIALSVIVAIGLERLFVDTSFLGDVLVLTVGSHVVALACRRAGLGMPATALTSLVTLTIVVTMLFYGDTANAILPTSTTLDTLRNDLDLAWEIYANDSAPVQPVRGLVVSAGVLMWVLALLADWAAFRLRSPLEAVAPATGVFVFTALLGAPRHEIIHGALFTAGVAAVLLAMRAERQAREEVWVASGAARGVGATLRVGAAAGAVAVLAGVVGGPAFPGAGDPALIDITELDNGPDTRVVISPLVEVSASLVEQPDVEVFRVALDDPDRRDYWRLMALTEFDGRIWRRSSNFDEVSGPVDSDVARGVDTVRVRQTFTTNALGNIYLPAAYELAEVIDDGGVSLEYEQATGALVIRDDDKPVVESGYTYVIDSAVPDFDPAALPGSATAGLGGGFVDEFTQLPDRCAEGSSSSDACWPTAVEELARQITAGATTDLERARLLQDHFLAPGNFTYDIDVDLNHDVDDLESFLFDVRRGYCEQFASTFAAMARSVGLPARVAVGFTWGEWDAVAQQYVVRGEHAHAWPEVYFADAGWIPFDPTPGRNRPFDDDVRGIPGGPAQEGEGPVLPAEGPEPPTTTPPPTVTTAPTLPADGADPTDVPPSPFDAESGPDPTAGGDSASDGGAIPGPLRVLFFAVLGTALLAALVPLTRTLLRRRALVRVAADPVGRGELAWDDAVAALRLVDLRHRATETPVEFAARVATTSGLEVGPVDDLARHITVLRYGGGDQSDQVEHAIAAQAAAAEIRRACHGVAGRRRVVADAFDPRRLSPAS